MEPSLDTVRRELADIHESLLALPPDDFAERSRLKDRQNELRQFSHRLIDGQPLHDRAALQAAYERLQDVRDRLLDLHLVHNSTSAGDAGIEGASTNAVNKAIDAGIGIDEVEARLQEIIKQMRNSG
jgi:putative aminopeptidase FrvX